MNNIEFFNLVDQQSAIIRILSTSVDKIEKIGIHTIYVNGAKKKVRCLGNNCPLCDENEANERLAVHLWDYTDNKEKVWNRTINEKFINLLKDIEENWGNLSDCVIKITRDGDQFPQYSVTVQNPNKYPFPEILTKEDIDRNVGYRCCTYRSADELAEYMKTGFLPDHVKKKSTGEFIPKDQWIKKRNEEEQNRKNAEAIKSYESVHANTNTNEDDEDVFVDPFLR